MSEPMLDFRLTPPPTKDFLDRIQRMIYERYRDTGIHPKYILLGRREYKDLHLAATSMTYHVIRVHMETMDMDEQIFGVKLLEVARDSFLDVV